MRGGVKLSGEEKEFIDPAEDKTSAGEKVNAVNN
jgi:hypothetical protein